MEVVFLASIDNALVVDPTDSSTFYPEEDQALPGDKLEQIALSAHCEEEDTGTTKKEDTYVAMDVWSTGGAKRCPL